jgi:hypothetical protein
MIELSLLISLLVPTARARLFTGSRAERKIVVERKKIIAGAKGSSGRFDSCFTC